LLFKVSLSKFTYKTLQSTKPFFIDLC